MAAVQILFLAFDVVLTGTESSELGMWYVVRDRDHGHTHLAWITQYELTVTSLATERYCDLYPKNLMKIDF
jgi:hypothetical protein